MNVEPGMTAFVTGGGSGIGRGIALSLAGRGVRVGVCDIQEADAAETALEIQKAGGSALAIRVDVSDFQSVENGVQIVERAFGQIAIACNNAGVAMHGVPLQEITESDWDWVIDVNIRGVINGIKAVVPRMLASEGPAHIVNTASIGGFQVNPNFLTAAYSMSKFAVVALSEGLHNELQGTQVGVSILAPAAVDTGIHLSERSRPERLGGATVRPENHFMGDLIKGSMSPLVVGDRVVDAIESNDLYVFTHPDTRHWLDRRHAAIMAAFQKSEHLDAAQRVGAERQT